MEYQSAKKSVKYRYTVVSILVFVAILLFIVLKNGLEEKNDSSVTKNARLENARLKSENDDSKTTEVKFPSRVVIDLSESISAVEKEVPTQDPLHQVFVNEKGATTREVFKDEMGKSYREIRYVNDQIYSTERTFDNLGKLVIERDTINGRLKDERIFR